MSEVKNELTDFLRPLQVPYVVMGVGLPRTRKSEHLGRMGRDLGVKVIKPSTVHMWLVKQGLDGPGATEAELTSRVEAILSGGEPVIIDALHIDPPTTGPNTLIKSRAQKVEQFRGFGARGVMAAFFDHGLAAVLARPPQGGEQTSDRNIERLAKNLSERPVSIDEGLDVIARQDALGEPIRIVDYRRS